MTSIRTGHTGRRSVATSLGHLAARLGLVALMTLAVAAAAACGDNLKPAEPDAADVPVAVCGDGVVQPGEDCDDGDQLPGPVCDERCRFTCGNGVVDAEHGELCDPGIASGAGACPTACDDGQSCTQDTLSGSDCAAECLFADITVAADGDGCCPAGETSLTDDDCPVVCGNGVVEAGEVCDTAIPSGAGACPASCDDQEACTTDTLHMAGTCEATCRSTPITAPANGDGCCPPGANTGNDDDCLPGCGNSVVDPGETCDTAIAAGPGACPTTCSDGMVCTRDVLVNAGTCNAACTFPPITAPANGDGCCPPGANANNDTDCAPVCGNGVVEGTEQCDDGNQVDTDACNNMCRLNATPPVAFRFTDLDLRDPHVYVSFLGCRDVTDTQLVGFSVNNELQTAIRTDDDGDGLLELSPTIVFRAFTQAAGASHAMELHFADCTAPLASTSCRPGGGQVIMATATNQSSGTCLGILPGTVRPYTPAVTQTSSPCFVSSAVTVTIDLSGIPIVLRDARLAATFVGNPAGSLTNGLLRGFISETDANATIIPSSFPLVGGQPLSSLLPGGDPPGPGVNCAAHSDVDINSGVRGWWFYLNYPAARVPWSDN
ncbi:MAG: DUF4215 domain-containing protein [Kofleriaceae bacterium]|nr:DUF4215 domain-containing protein [Kofleriaceae bacterium]